MNPGDSGDRRDALSKHLAFLRIIGWPKRKHSMRVLHLEGGSSRLPAFWLEPSAHAA
jgi:hypothetical protein